MSTVALFTVHYVSDDCLPDSNVRVIGITEDPQNASAKCFLFQRSLDTATEDDQFGVYAISNEQGWTAYEPLDSYRLDQAALVLNFTAESAAMFGYPRTVRLELALNKHDIEVLSSGLGEVVGV